jgi:hypothetical protein
VAGKITVEQAGADVMRPTGSGTPNKGYQGKTGYRVTYRQTRS